MLVSETLSYRLKKALLLYIIGLPQGKCKEDTKCQLHFIFQTETLTFIHAVLYKLGSRKVTYLSK